MVWRKLNLGGVKKPVVVLPAKEVALGELPAPSHLVKIEFIVDLMRYSFGFSLESQSRQKWMDKSGRWVLDRTDG